MDKQPILSIAELEEGMKVEVKRKQTSTTREGVVTKINLIVKSNMVDGRPVRSVRISEVIITLADGEKCELTLDNFKYYKIKML